MAATRLPVWYIPHGGGPCFFMDPPPSAPEAWTGMEAYLRGIAGAAGARPRAILVISAHWLESRPTATAAAHPPLIYDYRGFPPHLSAALSGAGRSGARRRCRRAAERGRNRQRRR